MSIGPAIAFVAIGFVLALPFHADATEVLESETVRHLAEATLALILFTDASSVDLVGLRRDGALVGRLLGVGLPLTIGLGGLVAALLFPGSPLAVALLIGAILAPTDAALGLPVVTNPAVPTRIRRILNVESGLNDGIATPFVLLFLASATAAESGHANWLLDSVREVAIGALVGAGLGWLGGRLLVAADARRWTSAVSRQVAVLALAGGAYLASLAVGGNGFISAFVAGLAFGAASRHREAGAELFAEAAGITLSIGVWTIFGGTFLWSAIASIDDPRTIAYAALSLTAVRLAPVAIALAGARLGLPTVGFVGWFGPRGLASIVFGLVAVDALASAGLPTDVVAATVTWTVLGSVVAHGLSAGPLASRYGRWIARRAAADPGMPEIEDRDELTPASRSTWSRRPASDAGADGPTVRPR